MAIHKKALSGLVFWLGVCGLAMLAAVICCSTVSRRRVVSRFAEYSGVELASDIHVITERDRLSWFLGDGDYALTFRTDAAGVARIMEKTPRWAADGWTSGISRSSADLANAVGLPPIRSNGVFSVGGTEGTTQMKVLVVEIDNGVVHLGVRSL